MIRQPIEGGRHGQSRRLWRDERNAGRYLAVTEKWSADVQMELSRVGNTLVSGVSCAHQIQGEAPVIRVRQVFQAKYGRGDELVQLFKEFHANAEVPNKERAQILTDAAGQFFTVVTEYEVSSLGAWEEAFGRLMGMPQTENWFGRMMEVTESGRREFYNIVE